MASTAQKKRLCSKCNKVAGVLTCRGCDRDFCYPHVTEHRQQLNQHMEQLTTEHDLFQQAVADQETEPSRHPLITKINEWELTSIEKIRRTAAVAREDSLKLLSTQRTEILTKLAHLTQQLNKARSDDDYVETDLEEWKAKLAKLNEHLTTAHAIDFGHDASSSVLISHTSIADTMTDFFDRSNGDVQVRENGAVVVHGDTQLCASVRGRSEYSSGQHRLRFKIEELGSNGAFLGGILPKSVSMTLQQHALSENSTLTHNYHRYQKPLPRGIYLPVDHDGASANAGDQCRLACFVYQANTVRRDDVIELCIDCDRRIVYSTNERSRQTQNLNIDLTTCPFPWQFFIALRSANDRIRLCEQRSA